MPDGSLVGECANPAVPASILHDVGKWRLEGATMEDAIERLRLRTVPSGHKFTAWSPGRLTVDHGYILMHECMHI